MLRLNWVVALLPVLSVVLRSQPADGACPSFVPDEKIRKITPEKDRIFRFDGGYVAIVTNVTLDTDGSPVAYHPENKGTTDLCDGLDPIIDGKRVGNKRKGSPCAATVRAAMQAGWRRTESPSFCIYGFYARGTRPKNLSDCNAWGGAFGEAEIPRQGPDDPAPGFFISTTGLHNPGRAADDTQARQINADRVPYAVIPGNLVGKALPIGGIAWAWNPKSNRTASGVFGDTNTFGEISVAFAQKLEKGQINPIAVSALTGASAVPWPYRMENGKIRAPGGPSGPVVFVYFSRPPSPALSSFDEEKIDSAATALLRQFGGPDRLKDCVRPLLH